MTETPSAGGKQAKSVCWACFAVRTIIWAAILFVILTLVFALFGNGDLLLRLLWVGVGLTVVAVADLRLIVFRRPSRPSA